MLTFTSNLPTEDQTNNAWKGFVPCDVIHDDSGQKKGYINWLSTWG